jgi:hypothetical protein
MRTKKYITDGISVYHHKGANSRYMHIASSAQFFKEDAEFVIDLVDDAITIKKVRMERNSKSVKFHKAAGDWLYAKIKIDIPPGRYEFDEDESDEDVAVMYMPPR